MPDSPTTSSPAGWWRSSGPRADLRGLRTPELAREAFERTGAAAVALARGSLGNPWLFSQLLGERTAEPDRPRS